MNDPAISTQTNDRFHPSVGLRFAFVLPLLLAACSPARLLEASRVLRDIEAGEDPSALKQVTGAPECATLHYEVDGRRRLGDLYAPAETALAGLVVVPGANANGKDDPRLVAFATTMARARFEVLVPELPGLRDLRVRSDDANIIADALVALSRHRSRQGNATVGVVAISYTVGPTTLALLEGGARAPAHFMLGVGGYYDVEAAITFFTTGYYRAPGGPWRRREPNEYGRWFFANSNADFLDDPRDRELLEKMARRRLDDASADIDDLAAMFGPEGRAAYRLLVNDDPDLVAELIRALPARLRGEIAALDLSARDLSGLKARLFLVHGHDDPVIPETESVALAAAAPNAELYLLNSLQHVDPEPGGLGDTLRMLAAMYGVLRERDRVRAPDIQAESSPLDVSASPCRPAG